MHLKVLILCCFLFCVVKSLPRRIDEGGNGYVMIGNSNAGYKTSQESEEKITRSSGHAQPLVLYAKPSSDYHSGYGHPGVFQQPQNSLISANIHLLEPFMLVTFLLFVLSLLDKAKVSHFLRRNDQIQELNSNFTTPDRFESDRYHRNHQFLKTLPDHNETKF